MKSDAGQSGLYLLSWSQTQIDGRGDSPEEALAVGAYWRWMGHAVDITAATDFDPSLAFQRQFAANAAKSVIYQAVGAPVPLAVTHPDTVDRTFTLSDGRDRWVATLIEVPDAKEPLICFVGAMPPAEQPLRVDWVDPKPKPLVLEHTAGVVCFTPGTWIDTPGGARQIKHLAAGDSVVTADGGKQEIVWIGTRHVTAAEIRRTPDLAPVRIREGALGGGTADGDLLVSPDHRMIVRGRHEGTGEKTEVLVNARDLVNGDSILREVPGRTITYLHLLLEHHHILRANGFETESFHPAAASLDTVVADEKTRLFDVMPMLKLEPTSYGASARPVLSRAEAELMLAA